MAPAASVGPSVPSVPALKTTTRGMPAMSKAAARVNSWLRPPRPSPLMVTVVSPPVTMQAGDLAGFAFDGAGEDQGAVAELAGGAGGGVERQAVAADDGIAHAGEQGVGWLGRLGDFAAYAPLDAGADGGRHAMANGVAIEDGADGGEGGGVGSGGAGADD